MQGWLIVNSFMESQKFQELYTLLQESASKMHLLLTLKKNHQLSHTPGKPDALELPDFAIFWDKDIYLAKMLEESGLRLFNPCYGIEICDNKALTALALSKAGVPMPQTIIAPKTFQGIGYTDLTFLDDAIEKLGLPIVIKEVYGSFGQQVYLAHTKKEAEKIISKLDGKDFIMQEYIAQHPGQDLRVNVVGGQVVASILRYNESDFRSNITIGGKMTEQKPTPEQEAIAIKACKALGLDFAGVDILFSDKGPLICEVNSNPHFKTTLEATGVNLADRIIEYIVEKML